MMPKQIALPTQPESPFGSFQMVVFGDGYTELAILRPKETDSPIFKGKKETGAEVIKATLAPEETALLRAYFQNIETELTEEERKREQRRERRKNRAPTPT